MAHCLTCFTFPLALAAWFCLCFVAVFCFGFVFLFRCFSSCFASAVGCFDLYPRVLDDRQCFIARSAMRKKKSKAMKKVRP